MKAWSVVWLSVRMASLMIPLASYSMEIAEKVVCDSPDCLSQTDSVQSSPCMLIDNDVVDFGVVSGDSLRSHSFVVTNAGTAALVITGVYSDCGCTAAEYPRDPIMPGESGRILVTFNPAGRAPGYFTKLVRVRSNATARPYRLYIKGKVAKMI